MTNEERMEFVREQITIAIAEVENDWLGGNIVHDVTRTIVARWEQDIQDTENDWMFGKPVQAGSHVSVQVSDPETGEHLGSWITNEDGTHA